MNILNQRSIAIVVFIFIIFFSNQNKTNAQGCVHSVSSTSVNLDPMGDNVAIYLTTEECEYYTAYTNDSWIYIWLDYYEQMVSICADANHEGGRSGTVVIDNYDSENDFYISVYQDLGCSQLDSPGTITGTSEICYGNSANFSINAIEGASSYHWTLNGITVDGEYGTTATITFYYNVYSSPATITVCGYNACGDGITSTKSVTVDFSSSSATSVGISQDNVCPGTGVTLTANGGSLGAGASWKWYSGSCAGTYVGTGTSITVYPSTTTTYYVRAEGTCNNTSCTSGTVTVKTTSTAPSSVSLSDNNVCPGTNITLTVNGGSLGSGASWKWYSGSCAGTYVGTGTSIGVSPSTTTTYYVRAEGDCNNTTCASNTLTVKSTSTTPSSLNFSNNNVCPGTNVTLTFSGGSLGTGASWKWYSGSCGGTYLGTGTSISVNPSSTTTYYVRAEGDCNNTTCASNTLTIKSTSSAPTTLNLSDNNVCPGTNITLSVSGGSLGTGASWKWYSGSCAGTYVGTGTSISVNPSTTTAYYVRAEGDCNNTTCASNTLTVKSASTAPSSLNLSNNNVCPGTNVTLTFSGGSLGTGASWKWYSGSCGGTNIGTGTSISVNPSSTTTYYVRAEGDCNNTTCVSNTLTVKSTSAAPSSLNLSNNNVCPGTNVTLTLSGGSLGTGASWKWYSGSCGGTYLGTGTSISVNPSSTTTYYVRAEGDCNTTTCASGTLTVKSISTAPSTLNLSNNNVCPGTNVTLTFSGGSLGTGASWKWYSGSCGGTSVGTGTSISVNPSTTTTYYVRAEGDCNNTTCASNTLTVKSTSTAPASLNLSNNNVCPGTNVTLTFSGGSLGTGASWKWYSGSCGGTYLGTGTSISVNPSSSTSYYVRAEGDCNTTTCASGTLTVFLNLEAGVIAGNNTSCYGYVAGNITSTSGADHGSGSYTYSWEKSTNGGVSWVSAGGNTTEIDPYILTTTTIYRRKVTDNNCGTTAYSNTVTKTVRDQLAAGVISGDQTLCYNDYHSSITGNPATGGSNEYTYHWEFSTSGGYVWDTIASNSTEMDLYHLTTTTSYRRIVIDNLCGSETSNTITKTVLPTLAPGSIAQDQTINFNETPSTLTSIDTASGGLRPYNYQWQSSAYEYGTFTNIENATGLTYSPGVLASTVYLKRTVSDNGLCGTASSNTLKLKMVIPSITYLDSTEIPDPDNRPIDTALVVGSTSGNVSVTQLGGLSYSIPVFCSPGTRGVQPSLSLQYNSQSGNGLLGWGWNLGGLSSISRMVKPYYIDNEIKPINMVAADQYALDGNRLVLESGGGYQGALGSKYKTELETFTETTLQGTTGYGQEWFEVKNLKDNSIYEYGNGPNAYTKNSQNIRLSWFLTKYMDGNGNYIKYNYLPDPATGQPFLYSIDYTGNINTNLQPYNQIVLDYKKRADSCNYYQAGVKLKNDLLISKIFIKNQGTTIRTYTFEYSYNFYSFLRAIKETTGIGLTYNSTIFKYNEVPQSTINYSDLTTTGKFEFTFADFNGDGKSDFALIPVKPNYSSSDKIKIYINQDGTDFQHLQDININPYTIDLGNDGIYYFGKFAGGNVADFDGDGKADFYTVESVDNLLNPDYINGDIKDRKQNRYTYYHFLGDSLSVYEPKVTQIKWSMIPGDFDGDGKSECFYFTPEGNQYSNAPGADSSTIGSNLNFTTKIGPIDFNGDGIFEIYSLDNHNYMHIYKYDYSNNQITDLITPFYFDYGKYCFGDVNGDGKTDLFAYRNVKYEVYLSDGFNLIPSDSSFISSEFIPYYYFFEDFLNSKFTIADINGDGKGELIQEVVLISNGVHETTIIAYFFNGNSYSSEVIDSYTDKRNVYYSDLNGDGQNDLYIRPEPASGVVASSKIWRIRPNDKSRLLSTILNGMNNKSKITYGALPQSSAFSNSTTSYDFPVRKLTLPIYLIENIKSYGQGENSPYSNFSYAYQDLRFHVQGKGFLGFLNTTIEDSVSHSKTETEYGFGSQFYNVFPHKSKQYLNNILLSENSDSILVHSYDSGKRYFPYVSQSSSINKLNNTVIESNSNITDSGNLVERVSKSKSSSGSIVKQISESYSGYNDYGLPTSISVTSKRGNDTITRTKSLEYFQNTTLLKKETRNFGSSPSIVTSYAYDDFGNPITVTIESGSISRTNSISYEPGKGRFIVSKSDPLNRVDFYSVDPVFGNVLKDSTHSGQITSYDYNDFGKLTSTHYPAGQVVHKSIEWSLGTENVGETYSEIIESANTPVSISYFDYSGKNKRSKTQSFDGSYLFSDNIYDYKGRLIRKNLPYFDGSPADQYMEYSYDTIGRLAAEKKMPDNVETEYEYLDADLKMKITKGGKEYFKQNEASGLLFKATDPGGTITYNYNAEDKVKSIVSPSGTTFIDYNIYGYQDTLHDLDAGKITYNYNALGELLSQTDAKSNTLSMEYDLLGRITHKSWSGGGAVSYTYNQVNDQLSKISSALSKKSFTYDSFNRLAQRSDSVDGMVYIESLSYNSIGSIQSILYNSAVSIDYVYNTLGYLNEVKVNNQSVWYANSMNRYGMVNNFTLGNQTNTSLVFDSYGFPDSILTVRNGSYLQRWNYDFDPSTGNLSKRKGLTSSGSFVEETFNYDDLNRLTSFSNSLDTINIGYDQSGNGNISQKTDVGNYDYSSGIHNVSSILNPTALMQSLPKHKAEYTSFNKISYLHDSIDSNNKKELFLSYGPDEQRIKTLYKVNNNTIKTKYFALGSYEKEIDSVSTVRELYYISSPNGIIAILQKKNNQDTIFYIHTDNLGSFDVVTKPDGTVKERYNFDPWGRRRNPVDWSYNNIPTAFHFDRGFTGHEQLDQFALINMNGRVYDPLLAMFLSPDNYISSPNLTHSFGRYSYCFNNPLLFTDPDGDNPLLIAGLIVGGITGTINLVAHWKQVNNFWDGAAAFGIGFGAGFIGTITGGAAFTAAGGAAAGVGGFMAGSYGSGIGYAYSTAIQSLGNSLYFNDPMPTSKQLAKGLGFSMIVGGALQGANALLHGRNFWNGNLIARGRNGFSLVNTPKPANQVPLKPLEPLDPYNSYYQNNPELKLPDQLSYYTADDPSKWTKIGKVPDKPIYLTPNSELSRIVALNDLALERMPNFRIDISGPNFIDPNKIMIIRRVTGNVFEQGGGGWEIMYRGQLDLNQAKVVITILK